MVAATSQHNEHGSVAKVPSRDETAPKHAVQWDKKMSNNCACALLVYTLLQIFVVVSAIETKGMSIAPYFGLVLLVAIIIPFCRKYERRWQELAKSNLPDAGLATRFRKDQLVLWVLALGLPFLFVVLFRSIAAMF